MCLSTMSQARPDAIMLSKWSHWNGSWNYWHDDGNLVTQNNFKYGQYSKPKITCI